MKAAGGRFSRKISVGRVKNFPLSADKKSAAMEYCPETNPASSKSERYFRTVSSVLWIPFAITSGVRTLVPPWEEWQHR
jgi:hypothetical protein